MDWHALTFRELVDHVGARHADREAFVGLETRVTHAEVLKRVRRLAFGLSRAGVGPGDHVCLLLPNRQEWIDCYLALGYLGATTVPINTRYTPREVEYTLRDSEATALIATDETLKPVAHLLPVGGAPSSGLRTVIALGGATEGSLPYAALTADVAPPDFSPPRVDPGSIALIQYTSGTTSFPKGVMLSHQQIIRDAYMITERLAIDERDRMASPMPFFHVGGSVISILFTYVRGACLVYPPHFDAAVLLRLIEQERATAIAGIQTMWSDLLEAFRAGDYDVRSLRTGWGIVDAPTLRALVTEMGISQMANAYGLSETSPNVSVSELDDPLPVRESTQGLPHPGLEFAIADVGSGRHLPPEQPGEILVRGWAVMQGYYRQPDATRAAIDPDGWLHTGDLGSLRPDGRLRVQGRIKDMLRVGGENVAAQEIEMVLAEHPAIAVAAVVGLRHARLGEVPVAFVQAAPGGTVSPDEIMAFCRARLASFKVPRRILPVERFPVTSSGKIQKFKLREEAERIAQEG